LDQKGGTRRCQGWKADVTVTVTDDDGAELRRLQGKESQHKERKGQSESQVVGGTHPARPPSPASILFPARTCTRYNATAGQLYTVVWRDRVRHHHVCRAGRCDARVLSLEARVLSLERKLGARNGSLEARNALRFGIFTKISITRPAPSHYTTFFLNLMNGESGDSKNLKTQLKKLTTPQESGRDPPLVPATHPGSTCHLKPSCTTSLRHQRVVTRNTLRCRWLNGLRYLIMSEQVSSERSRQSKCSV
jgi:hypothetical protein